MLLSTIVVVPSGCLHNCIIVDPGWHMITFNTLSGSAIDDQIVVRGNPATRPSLDPTPNPSTMAGFIFVDWFACPFDTTPFNFSTPIYDDITLYARWRAPNTDDTSTAPTLNLDPYTVAHPHFASFHINLPGATPPANINASFLPLDRYEWQNATFSVTNSYGNNYDFNNITGRIRGRGNSTWNIGTRANSPSTQKWPFRIRLDAPRSMLGMNSVSTDWSFIANLSDYTLMRNEAAKFFSRQLCGMDWQTQSRFVHVYFNGQYRGVYWVAEQLEVSNYNEARVQDRVEGRIPLTYNPNPALSEYFIELDLRANDPPRNDPNRIMIEGVDYIRAAGRVYDLRFPDDTRENGNGFTRRTPTVAHVNYARTFIENVDNALAIGNWTNIQNWIDIDSFVDFYIVHEFFKNIDSGGLSVHMTIRNTPNGRRVFKGPIWDFDLTAGNNDPTSTWGAFDAWNARGGYTTAGIWPGHINRWFRNLLRVPQFFELVRVRFDYLAFGHGNGNSAIDRTIRYIHTLANVYQSEFDRNFTRWNLLGRRTWAQPPCIVQLNTHNQNVMHLINWLHYRRLQLSHFFNNGNGINDNATLWTDNWLPI